MTDKRYDKYQYDKFRVVCECGYVIERAWNEAHAQKLLEQHKAGKDHQNYIKAAAERRKMGLE